MLIRAAIALLATSIAVRAETFAIAVGASGLTFNPTSVAAKAGDIVTFSLSVVLVLPPPRY
jgi:plastocyanin